MAKKALIAAAERIFNRDGYFGTDSNAIARAAGYAPASFYTHFKDKLEIFLVVYRRWVAREWRVITSAAQHGGLQGWLNDIASGVLAHHQRWSTFRKSLRAMAAIEPAVRIAQNEQRRRQITWLQRVCVARGLRKPDAATSAALLLATERILDAAAEQDVLALGADVERIRKVLAKFLYIILNQRL